MNQNIFCSKCHRIPSQCCCSSAEIQALHNLVKEQDKKIIYNNAVGVPNPDGWELTTDSSNVATWKAYEEVRFNPDLIHRWVREGDEYVNRMTKEQMEILKKASEK